MASITNTLVADAPSFTTYANVGACRRAARNALGRDSVRKVDFDMKVDENGRWTWWALKLPATVGTDSNNAPVEQTREDWLRELGHRVNDTVFAQHGEQMPAKWRISCSFPGGGSARKRIGECWSKTASRDGTTEMFISPVMDDTAQVAGVVVHEMVHAIVGVEHGHKAPFKALGSLVGLVGKPTEMHPGEELAARLQPMLDDMGPYPHAALDLKSRKKKQTYLIKVACQSEECEAVFRITQKFITDEMSCPCCQGPVTVG